jgi:aprataxin
MDSVYLKNKKHWNSFTTEFFLDVDDVIKTLEGGKRLEYKVDEKEELLKRDMKCQKCGEVLRNMPKLKEHLRIEHD